MPANRFPGMHAERWYEKGTKPGNVHDGVTLLVFATNTTQATEDVLGELLFDNLSNLEVLAPLQSVSEHLARIWDLEFSTRNTTSSAR